MALYLLFEPDVPADKKIRPPNHKLPDKGNTRPKADQASRIPDKAKKKRQL